MTQQKHTPTPWYAVNEGTDDEPMMSVKAARIAGKPPKHCVAIIATGDNTQEMEDANAAHIVKCVNAHDDLVKALQYARPFILGLVDETRHGIDALEQIDAALAKAQVQP